MVRVLDYIQGLVPYKPGKPIAELKRELGLKEVIKLASNENPVGTSPKALAALRAAIDGGELNRYPDGGGYYLKEGLAAHWGLSPEHFILGNAPTRSSSSCAAPSWRRGTRRSRRT